MPKLDKSKLTKEQARALLAERRRLKAIEKIQNAVAKKTLNEHDNKSYGFVLGNGTSRKDIKLEPLKEYGTVYGCNALYREFDPDYLVAVDAKMIVEIDTKKYQIKNPNVWTNHNRAFKYIEGLNYFRPSKGWSSGPTALWLASQHEHDSIFILGFDYKGLQNGKRVNNMYAGTPNYKRTTDAATYYGNWLKQTKNVLKENPLTTYYRVITPDNYVPQELNNFSNLKHITVEDFKKMFNFS